VLLHAKTLLTSSAAGATDYIDADLRDTERILREAGQTLHFGQPVAVMFLAVLHFVTDAQDPAGIVRTLMDALPPGSYLAIGHHTADIHPKMIEFARRMSELNPEFVATLRDRAEVTSSSTGSSWCRPVLFRSRSGALTPTLRPPPTLRSGAESPASQADASGTSAAARPGQQGTRPAKRSAVASAAARGFRPACLSSSAQSPPRGCSHFEKVQS
jgi:S-adenosyl methyltransferase